MPTSTTFELPSIARNAIKEVVDDDNGKGSNIE